MRLIFLAAAVVALMASHADAGDQRRYSERFLGKQKTYDVRQDWYDGGKKIGTIYDPGYNRPLQIRDNQRVIHGYIERDGTITNTSRQEVGTIELGD